MSEAPHTSSKRASRPVDHRVILEEASAPLKKVSIGTEYVIDASVGAKWVLKEEYSDPAKSLLKDENRLLAPSLFYSEITNILWKRANRSDITKDQARLFLREILSVPLEVTQDDTLAANALEIALATGRSAYDSHYLALALMEGISLVTGDEKLYHALSPQTDLGSYIVWVGNL